MAVYDIATDELATTIDVPCPTMDVASLGDDGYLYVSGWSYMPLSVIAGYSPKNCAARIDVGALELDQSWLLSYADATGEQGSALRAVAGNEGIFAVFHGTRNRFWVFVKNTPPVLFWLTLPMHLSATTMLFARHASRGEFKTPWRGLMAGIGGLPVALAARREAQARRKVGSLAIARAMTWNPLDLLYRRVVIRPPPPTR